MLMVACAVPATSYRTCVRLRGHLHVVLLRFLSMQHFTVMMRDSRHTTLPLCCLRVVCINMNFTTEPTFSQMRVCVCVLRGERSP
jgi:hypothetical protein